MSYEIDIYARPLKITGANPDEYKQIYKSVSQDCHDEEILEINGKKALLLSGCFDRFRRLLFLGYKSSYEIINPAYGTGNEVEEVFKEIYQSFKITK